MITIDGEEVQEITIDGEEVQEVTIDGDVVWTAGAFPDPDYHYDATTIGFSNGSNVGNWHPEVGGQTLSVTSGNAPSLQTSAVAGNDAVYFDGTEWLYTGSFSGPTQPLTVFVVAQYDAAIADYEFPFGGATTTEVCLGSFNNTTEYAMYPGSTFARPAGYDTNAGSPVLHIGVADGANSTHQVIGPTTDTDTGSGTEGLSGFSVGTRGDGTNPFTGYVGEIIIYNRLLSSSERTDVNQHLRSKWNI